MVLFVSVTHLEQLYLQTASLTEFRCALRERKKKATMFSPIQNSREPALHTTL